MNKRKVFRRAFRAGLWLAVFSLTGAIFFFSSQPAVDSLHSSDGVLKRLIAVFGSEFQAILWIDVFWKELLDVLIRKGAHFFEYALLGGLLRLLLQQYHVSRPDFDAWLIGALYGCTDELHQVFVPGRAGLLADAALDSLGVLFGVWLAGFLRDLLRRGKRA